jgi:hypothetical protein
MKKLKVLQIAIVILSVTISSILFTSCQKEPTPIESNQTTLQKFTLPTGATFVSATFNIYVQDATNQNIDVHRITSSWQECVVTWANFGGSYAPAIEGTFNASSVGWKSVDVTSLVGSWLNGTNPNYGLLLDQVNKTWPRTVYVSMRSPDEGPYLEICYTLNGSTVCDTTRAIGDTYIYENIPDRNSCTDFVLYTGWGWETDLEKQTLIQFDLGYTPPPQEVCETAYAYGGSYATCFLNLSPISANNWGWTNNVGPGTYNWPIYAGAGQCDISKGTLVGNLNVVYSGGTVTITYQLNPGYTLDETHVWIGTNGNKLPWKNGKWETAPGQFNYNGMNPVVKSGLSGNIWIAAHAGVCWEVE